MSDYQIPLNGSNYISEQRKEAFQSALEDGHAVQPQSGNGKFPERQTDPSPTLDQDSSPAANPQSAPLPRPTPAAKSSAEQITQGVSHSIQHQNRTLDIHQQYLEQQREYAEIFRTLLDQQAGILENGAGTHRKEIVANLQRSLEGFHRVQEKELEVHQQFLHQQAEFSRAFVQLLEHQHQLPRNGAVPAASAPSNPTQPEDLPAVSQAAFEPAAAGDSRQAKTPLSPDPIIKATAAERQAGPTAGSPPVEELASTLLGIVAEKTGYPVEMLELSMDMEADLGIDSIKRVEILGSLEDAHPDLPPADTEVLAETRTLADIIEYMKSAGSSPGRAVSPTSSLSEQSPGADKAPASPAPETEDLPSLQSAQQTDLDQLLLELVAEKTGYPVEMLALDMDMEADLGIDSIKRVEILGAMEDRVPDLPPVEAEALGELRTLQEILTLMNERTKAQSPAPTHPEEGKKKFDPDGLTPLPVELLELPRPDRLAFSINPNHPLLVTDEGSDLTPAMIQAIKQAGWPVLLIQPPGPVFREDDRDFPSSLPRISLPSFDPEDIGKELSRIRSKHQELAGLIHLHPGRWMSGRDRPLVKMVFFMAKYLGKDLKEPDPQARKLFLTATQIDGALGLRNQADFQESSGFSGLIKTLHWEWPQVFCRAVDLDPGLPVEDKASFLMAEIQDPQRGLQEVGLSADSRVTPATRNG